MEASSVVVPGHHLQRRQQQDGNALEHGSKLGIVNADNENHKGLSGNHYNVDLTYTKHWGSFQESHRGPRQPPGHSVDCG